MKILLKNKDAMVEEEIKEDSIPLLLKSNNKNLDEKYFDAALETYKENQENSEDENKLKTCLSILIIYF